MLYGTINRRIINLSKRPATRDMKRAGVFDLPTVLKLKFEEMIDFNDMTAPSVGVILSKTEDIAQMVDDIGAKQALIDVPVFMASSLERELLTRGITPLYPWCTVKRYSVESELNSDIQTIKCSMKLIDFIEVCEDGQVKTRG